MIKDSTPTPQSDVAHSETGIALDHYVAGFMFDSIRQSQVALIRKNKPAWQRGKLNGIGGKVEQGENIFDCMVREFEEETGYKAAIERWDHFLTMSGGNDDGRSFRVDFFVSVGNLSELQSVESEKIERIPISEICVGRADMIENLPWLIGLALDYLQDGRPCFVNAHYPSPNSSGGNLNASGVEREAQSGVFVPSDDVSKEKEWEVEKWAIDVADEIQARLNDGELSPHVLKEILSANFQSSLSRLLAEKEEELKKAIKDKERLDWFEANMNWRYDFPLYPNNLREAIDTAALRVEVNARSKS